MERHRDRTVRPVLAPAIAARSPNGGVTKEEIPIDQTAPAEAPSAATRTQKLEIGCLPSLAGSPGRSLWLKKEAPACLALGPTHLGPATRINPEAAMNRAGIGRHFVSDDGAVLLDDA